MRLKKNLFLALAFPVQILLIKLLAFFPNIIERYYSNGVYLFISKALRYGFGWIPFSVGDLCYLLLLLFCCKWLYKNRTKLIRNPIQSLMNITAFLSVLYFLFHLLWGLNYYRPPLHKNLAIKHTYTTDELFNVTENLISKANELHLKIAANDTLNAIIPYSKKQVYEKTSTSYANLQLQFPSLVYPPKSIKQSLWSVPLTYAGYSGYLNPFTNEAQVNYLIPKFYAPFVSCHEAAHQIGYAAENETNFIGYLACTASNDVFFNYAGATFAVRYCLNELHKRDKNKYEYLLQKLNIGILKDYQKSKDFWNSYQTPLELFFKYSYDLFLKSNNQQKGIKSYSYVVALLVNYQLQQK